HDYRNGLIPDAAVPNGHLAFFWDDMRSNQGGTIYYRAEPDSGRFIMQYQDVIRYQTATPHTMQVILKDNGDITYQYADVPEPQSATVGIENADGTVGTQVAYNDPDYLHNGLAIHFDYPGQVDWATVVPDTGSVAPGGNTPISVEFDAAGLPDGTYLGELAIQSNDPVNPVYYVPVTMTVSSVSGVGDVQVPRQLVFQGAVPNPFNPTTSLKYSLPRQARVSLNIYDVSGRLVRRLVSETQQPGPQEAVWDGRDNSGRGAASGLFYARLVVGAEVLVKKMTLVR
ncbi:MAG: FlgD immunoglobulin-like domain containing protein, partial [Candidatus Krumholzibacteriota bacterium]